VIKTVTTCLGGILLAAMIAGGAFAQNGVSISTGADFYSRYVWRGLDIASTPSLQPSFSIGYRGAELGVWGAYTLSNEASESDEIDFWCSYTVPLKHGASLSAIVTDYYYPNSGIRFFNFNDYDAVRDDSIPDPGAHLLEAGLAVTGPESFPITVAGYINVYNEAGNNTYFQVDYPLAAPGTALDFFVGATGGSKDNPGYYGPDDLAVINFGVTATRELKIGDETSLPLKVSFIINPQAEISYLLVGVSL